MPGGRPPKSDKGPADTTFLIRLRKEEKEAFQTAAEQEGKSLTEWIMERLRPAIEKTSWKRRPKG